MIFIWRTLALETSLSCLYIVSGALYLVRLSDFSLIQMSLERRATLAEQLFSSRNPTRCLVDRESPHRWGILSRPFLKHRSNSAPMESLDTLQSRIRSKHPVLVQDLTCSTSGSYTLPANLPDVRNVTSSGMLLEHVPPDLPCSAYKRAPYLRSASEPGTTIITEPQPLQRKPSSLPFSGILLSMSRRISRILTAREEPESMETAEAGRNFLFKSTACLLDPCWPGIQRFIMVTL